MTGKAGRVGARAGGSGAGTARTRSPRAGYAAPSHRVRGQRYPPSNPLEEEYRRDARYR